MTTLMLVDGSNIVMRALTASERKSQFAGAEVKGPALHLFITSLARHVREQQPDGIVVCWDEGRSEYRTGLFPAYKANRHAAPDHAREAVKEDVFTAAQRFLRHAKIAQASWPSVEADDLIAAGWQDMKNYGNAYDELLILSGDKDLLQLVEDPWCSQIKLGSDPELWDESRMDSEYGFKGIEMAYWLAMVGDASDGIPGVKGVGPKKAAGLFAQSMVKFGGIDSNSIKDLLGPERAQEFRLALALVNLRDPLPKSVSLFAACNRDTFEFDSQAIYKSLGLYGWLDKHDLKQVRAQCEAKTLWEPKKQAPPNAEGLGMEEVLDT